MSMLRWIFIAAICIQVAVLQGCVFGPGPKCAFPCRCHDATGTGLVTSGGSCNPVTGGCPSGVCINQARTGAFVGQYWSGDGCQTGNVALGKTAFITNTGAKANNIVDGWISSGYNCTSVDTGDIAAAVTVDLGGLYTITGVDVWNTHDSAESVYLRNFIVKHGNEDPSLTQVCQVYTGDVRRGFSHSSIHARPISCSPSTPVRYITIEKSFFATTRNKMSMCEISVFGKKYYDVDCSRCNSGKCHPDQWCEQCLEGWTGHDCNTVEPLSVPTLASTLTPITPTVALCNTTTTSYKLYTDNSSTHLQTNNNNPTTLSTNYHNPAPQTPSSTQPQKENTVQLSCSCTCDNTTSSAQNNNPTSLITKENLTPLPTNENNPTSLATIDKNLTPQPTNEIHPTSIPTNDITPTPLDTNDNNPTPQPTNDITSTTLDIPDHNPTHITTNKRNPIPLPTLGHNHAPLPTEDNNPSTILTNNNDPTPPSTNDNSLTPQTPSSTPQDGSTNQQLNNSFVYDNSLVTIPAAILSVIVLILVILLIGSFCYNMSLRRRLKGMKTDRMGDFSDMYMTHYNSVTGDAITPAARTHRTAPGRNPNRAAGHPTPYYNTVTRAAVMPIPDTNVSIHGEAGGLYEEVAGSREPAHPAVYLGLGQNNNN